MKVDYISYFYKTQNIIKWKQKLIYEKNTMILWDKIQQLLIALKVYLKNLLCLLNLFSN